MDSIKIVSGMLTGDDFQTVRLGGRLYMVRNPWTVTLARAIGKLSPIGIPDKATKFETLMLINEYAPKVAAFIAVLAVGNVRRWGVMERLRYRRAYRDAMRTTEGEKKEALYACLSLVNGSDFFDYASVGVTLADQMAKPRQE